MRIFKNILTNNKCFKVGKKNTVKGLMIHSVGCPQPSALSFIRQWNAPNFNKCCVHAILEPNGNVYQTLPWNYRGWHCGCGFKGSANSTHGGVEMTEPATIKYIGGASWIDLDPVKTRQHVMGTYKTAVELFAYLCEIYRLDPLKDGVIISHSEGHKRQIASNHGDVEHIWNRFGLTMAQFRRDIKTAMLSLDEQLKIKFGLADETVRYLMNYKYGRSLAEKLLNGEKVFAADTVRYLERYKYWNNLKKKLGL